MTCPTCGATVQPYDRFCTRCGHDLQGGQPARPQEPAASGSSTPVQHAPYGQPTPLPVQQAPYAQPPQNNPDRRWASGSSLPAPNPYANTPNTVSGGMMLNGRPVRSNAGGAFKGLGAAVAALLVILGKFGAGIAVILAKFGAAIAGLGIFKFFLYWSLFRILFGAATFHLGWLAILIIVLLIVAAVRRS